MGSSGTFILSGGSFAAPSEDIGISGSGSFTQTGGTNSAGTMNMAYAPYGFGVYNLNGGLLLIGSGGILPQSNLATVTFGGGTLGKRPWSTSIVMAVTGSGAYSTVDTTGGNISLSGNLTGSGTLSKVGPGVLSVSGTSSNIGGLIVNGGTLQFPSGSLAAGNEYLGYSATGALTQTGGTHAVANTLNLGYNSGSYGSYNLSGNGLLYATSYEYVGNTGSGSFVQSKGTNNVGLALYLGYNAGSSGAYTLNGGLLALAMSAENATVYIGYSGSGSFTQSSGTNSVFATDLAKSPGSSGSYLLSGGSLVENVETVGDAGSGVFTQSGGTHSMSKFYVGANLGSSGTYNLSAGSFSSGLEVIALGGSGGIANRAERTKSAACILEMVL